MAKLKDLRVAKCLTQAELAQEINVSQSELCSYENDNDLPIIEDMIILTNKLGAIEWKDNHSFEDKQHILRAINDLAEQFPLPAVFEFVARNYRRTPQIADQNILFFANSASQLEALYPNFPNTQSMAQALKKIEKRRKKK